MALVVNPLTVGLSWVVMLLGGAGIGIPLGTPPAAEDPVLMQIAPDECLYYMNWSGRVEANPKSSNAAERFLAEEEIQQFGKQALAMLRSGLQQAAGDDQSAEAKLVADLLPLLAEKILQGPGAIYVAEAQIKENGVEVEAALIVDVTNQGQQVNTLLGKFAEEVLQRPAQKVVVDGKPFQTLELGGGIPKITWGRFEKYLVVGFGEESVKRLLQRRQTPQPKWLTGLIERWPLERRSTVAYANLEQLRALLMPLVPEGRGAAMAELLGLNNLNAYLSVSGFDDQAFVSYSAITVDGQLQGVLSQLNSAPLTATDLEGVPADAMAALSFRLNADQMLQLLETAAKTMGQRDYQQFQRDVTELEKILGVKLKEELLAAFKNRWRIYSAPDTGGWLTGWVLSVEIKDRERLLQTQEKLLQYQQKNRPVRNSKPGFKKFKFLDREIVAGSHGPVCWSFAITESELLVGLYPQALKAHFKRSQAGASKGLASQPRIAQLLRDKPAPQAIQYLDFREVVRMAYPFLQIGARSLTARAQQSGLDVTMTALPSLESLLKHLEPSLLSVHRVADGIELRTMQTLPSNGMSVSAPVLVAALLPAVSAARAAARRMASANNLKQIGIAMHNFHETYGGLPAAYNTDKNGKPLLSWRVHLLPFVEGDQLYRQFKLDEPWDSEHNKKLISRMPAVYFSPASTNDLGKTNYMALRTTSSVIIPPKAAVNGKKMPIGNRIRDITDGTSNTVMVVEASDAKAVIWTKPDDFVPDAKDPAKGLPGLWRSGFQVLFSDGSVHFITPEIDINVLKAIYTRNGGEAFGANELP